LFTRTEELTAEGAENAEKNDFFFGKDQGTRVRVGQMRSFAGKGLEPTFRM
jgi:hypothetical protein